ncbi:MAG: hypothetical protein R2788_14920 [Saprospiraceae bacterium]
MAYHARFAPRIAQVPGRAANKGGHKVAGILDKLGEPVALDSERGINRWQTKQAGEGFFSGKKNVR